MRRISHPKAQPRRQLSSKTRAVNVARGRVPMYQDQTVENTVDMLAQVLYDAGVQLPPDPIADARADSVANAHVRLQALIGTVIGLVPSKGRKAGASRTQDEAALNDEDVSDDDTPRRTTKPGDAMPDNEEELQDIEAHRAGKRVVSATPFLIYIFSNNAHYTERTQKKAIDVGL
jgi:hypothetical protein